MKKYLFILIILFAVNAKAQEVDKELKSSGSLIIPETKIASDTSVRFYTHCAPTLPKSKTPLLIVNGKRKSLNLISGIDANNIESVSVVKPPESVKKYGRKAKAGAIIIKMKTT